MKFIGFLLGGLLFSIFCEGVSAQNCQVLLPAIAGKYTGGCKQGKAEGNGSSQGTDSYTGQFKAGLPDGKGTYTWVNGDVYKGEWAKGHREGEGSLAIKRDGKADSLVKGMWKNDLYVANYKKPEKPYIIHQRSNYFSRVDFRKNTNSKSNELEITITSVSAGTSSLVGIYVPPATISGVNVITGNYGMVRAGATTPRGTTNRYLEIAFPFRAILTVGGQELDFEITEPGSWNMTLAINQ